MTEKDSKKPAIKPEKVAEEFAGQGLIPEEYQEDFAEVLDRELRRETCRFGIAVASAVVRSLQIRQAHGMLAA